MKWVCDISASFFVHRLEISLQPSCVYQWGTYVTCDSRP